MTKAMLIKTAKGLRGATVADHEAYTKFRRKLELMKPGTWLRMEWVRPRNGPQHRKFFALLSLVAENSEIYNTTEKALVAVKLCGGYFDLMADPTTGEIVKVPQSISFENMDQDRFEVFYGAAVDAILQHILPQLDRERAEWLMDKIIEGWA